MTKWFLYDLLVGTVASMQNDKYITITLNRPTLRQHVRTSHKSMWLAYRTLPEM